MPEPSHPVTPPGRLSRLYNSVSLRLFLLLFGVVVAGGILQAVVSARSTSSQWMAFLEQSAGRTSELIKRGTYYGMLLNRKEEIHRTIGQIAQTPDVAGVRIYDTANVLLLAANLGQLGIVMKLYAVVLEAFLDDARFGLV